MKKYILVIIDMQEQFYNNCRHSQYIENEVAIQLVVNNIRKEVLQAKKLGNQIVVVSYDGGGRNLPAITKAYQGYEKVKRAKKYDDDGGDKVDASLKDTTLPLRICGVNSSCCVYETALSLRHDFGYTVEVMQTACWDENGMKTHLDAMKDLGIDDIIVNKVGWKPLLKSIKERVGE